MNSLNPQRLMPGLALAAALWLGVATPAVAENHVVQVRDGSVPALIVAIHQAIERPIEDTTELILTGTFRLQPGDVIPAIEFHDITVRGGVASATITAAKGWEGPIFEVGVSGGLEISNLEISGIELVPDELLLNLGTMELRNVQFRENVGATFCLRFGCPQVAGRIITNLEGGRLVLNGVSFIDSRVGGSFSIVPGVVLFNAGEAEVSNTQVYIGEGSSTHLFVNHGNLDIRSSSFFLRLGLDFEGGLDVLFSDPGFTGSDGVTTMANSIVTGFASEWCNYVDSQGYNIVDADGCGFDAEGDLVGIGADLIFAPVETSWSAQGGGVVSDALVPLAGSRAVDSSAAEYCTGGSLLGPNRVALDGDGDGITACDRGAVEREPTTVAKGGINGLYYNPDADGHYLYIAETTYTTMVMWTTFDNQGRQAWVFGIGDGVSENGRLVTDAYLNRNGRVRPDGSLKPANAMPWGRIEVRMSSCDRGRLIYESDQPGFGSGEFQFRRLAHVDSQDCVEGP